MLKSVASPDSAVAHLHPVYCGSGHRRAERIQSGRERARKRKMSTSDREKL